MNNSENHCIKLIFAEVKKIIPKNLDRAHEWLGYVEEDALKNDSSDWINILRYFIRGLWGAEVIELEDLDDIDKLLEKNGL